MITVDHFLNEINQEVNSQINKNIKCLLENSELKDFLSDFYNDTKYCTFGKLKYRYIEAKAAFLAFKSMVDKICNYYNDLFAQMLNKYNHNYITAFSAYNRYWLSNCFSCKMCINEQYSQDLYRNTFVLHCDLAQKITKW